jgi:hypothetical protein
MTVKSIEVEPGTTILLFTADWWRICSAGHVLLYKTKGKVAENAVVV